MHSKRTRAVGKIVVLPNYIEEDMFTLCRLSENWIRDLGALLPAAPSLLD